MCNIVIFSINVFYLFQIIQFLKLIIDIYNNSSTSQQILNFQKSADFNILISTIRLTTTVTKNSTNVSIVINVLKILIKFCFIVITINNII